MKLGTNLLAKLVEVMEIKKKSVKVFHFYFPQLTKKFKTLYIMLSEIQYLVILKLGEF